MRFFYLVQLVIAIFEKQQKTNKSTISLETSLTKNLVTDLNFIWMSQVTVEKNKY